MIALCVPMYANSFWCGREWQAMTELAKDRLPEGSNPFFVVRLGKLDPHPAIMAIQQFWAPNKGLRRLHLTAGFDAGLEEVLGHVLRVLELSQAAAANCDGYKVPNDSAFLLAATPITPNRRPEG